MKPERERMNLGELRKRAEEKLKEREEKVIDLPARKVKELVHELGTFQIELEIQNEDLRLAQEVLEESRRKYSDLYDFAPVGYITLDKFGTLLEMNLTAARLLRIDRDKVLRKPTATVPTTAIHSFLYYISPEDKNRFRQGINDALSGKDRVMVEIGVKRNGGYFPAQFQLSADVEQGQDILLAAFYLQFAVKEDSRDLCACKQVLHVVGRLGFNSA